MAAGSTPHYDAYISVSDSLQDKDWVEQNLAPAFKAAGLRYITNDDFDDLFPGFLVDAIASAIAASRYTLFILTPAWIDSGRGPFEKALAQLEDPRGVKHRIVLLWLQECPIPDTFKIYTKRDFRQPDSLKKKIPNLTAHLLPLSAKPDVLPRALSLKIPAWISDHPIRATLLTLSLLITLSAVLGVPRAEGWTPITPKNFGGDARFIMRIGETLFVTTRTNEGCSDLNTGLYRGVERGQTWDLIDIPDLDFEPTKDGCDSASIEAIVASTQDPKRLYAATSNVGLLVSEDDGISWNAVDPATELKQQVSLAILPSPERLYVVGRAPVTTGLYRSTDGIQWQRLDVADVCQQAGYVSLPTAATINAYLLTTNDLLYVAPSDLGELGEAAAGADIYYSADGGDCWRSVHDLTDGGTLPVKGKSYSALAAIPDASSEVLYAAWELQGMGRKIWRINWKTGQEQFLGDMPFDANQILITDSGTRWYATTPFGLVFRGNLKQYEGFERLSGPISFYADMTTDFESDSPLLLSGGRVFRRSNVGWWQSFFP